MIGTTSPRAAGGRRRSWIALALALVVLAGLGWAAWWVLDNLGAPGPGATGSGPCSSADAVNLELVYPDGHTVQACTRDRPACPNQTGPAVNGSTGLTEFRLSNQLRSTSRRYILFVRFDGALPAEAPEQAIKLDPQVAMGGLPRSTPGNGMLTSAEVQITPRDPDSEGYMGATGSLTVSSAHGQAHGRIDGNFSGVSGSAVRVTGTFACNR